MLQIKHLGYSRLHKVARAQRISHRQGLILHDGLQVKRRSGRSIEISQDHISENFGKLIDAVASGIIEITCEDGYVLSPDKLQVDDLEPVLAEFKKHLGEDADKMVMNEQFSAPEGMVVSEGTPDRDGPVLTTTPITAPEAPAEEKEVKKEEHKQVAPIEHYSNKKAPVKPFPGKPSKKKE
jgi:hypothetical protein